MDAWTETKMNKLTMALVPVAIAVIGIPLVERTASDRVEVLVAVAVAASAAVLVGYRESNPSSLAEADKVVDRVVGRLEEVVADVRGALRDGEGLKKALDRSQVTQQSVVEKAVLAADKAAEASATLSMRDGEDARRAQEAAAEAKRDAEACRRLLMDTHGSLSLATATAPAAAVALAQLRKELEVRMRTVGLEVFGEAGEPVDGARHNVIGSQPTPDQQQDGRVAHVHKAGFRWGTIVYRADVIESVHEAPDSVQGHAADTGLPPGLTLLESETSGLDPAVKEQ